MENCLLHLLSPHTQSHGRETFWLEHWQVDAALGEVRPRQVMHLASPIAHIPCVAWHPCARQRWVYALYDSGKVHLIDGHKHERLQSWRVPHSSASAMLQWSPDGMRLALWFYYPGSETDRCDGVVHLLRLEA